MASSLWFAAQVVSLRLLCGEGADGLVERHAHRPLETHQKCSGEFCRGELDDLVRVIERRIAGLDARGGMTSWRSQALAPPP